MTISAPTRLVDGLVFGEGPRWRANRLWFSDMHGERVCTVDLTGRLETVVELPGRRPSGLGFLPDGTLLIVSMLEARGLALGRRAPHGPRRPAGTGARRVQRHGGRRCGNAYVGSFPPASDPDGVLVLVRPDGSTEIAADGLSFPNGCVIGDGGRTLIVAESLGRRLTRFTIADDATLSERRSSATSRRVAQTASASTPTARSGRP